MNEFYVEGGDDWNIWSCVVREVNVEFALLEALSYCFAKNLATGNLRVTDRATGTTRKLLCLGCEQCRVPIFEDEEWMLTDKVGQFQHVDCYAPYRVPS